MVQTVEIKVPDIQPEGFPIEIINEKGEFLVGISFNISIDGKAIGIRETGNGGLLKIPQPQDAVNLTLLT